MWILEQEIRGGYVAEMMQDTDCPDPRKEFLNGDEPSYDEIVEMWREGDVYEYAITDAQTGDITDSLCGMYGYEYAHQTMTEALDATIQERS